MNQPKVFSDILYAQCWEDPDLDREAFHIGPDDTVFTITSGGCNALAFLADGPRRVVAIDLNPCQTFLLQLKIAAFRRLPHVELMEFIGVRSSMHREGIYQALRADLPDDCRRYWDNQPEKISSGIMHCGRYERYMALLRSWTRTLMGPRLIDQFFAEDDPERRAALFHDRWDNIPWKVLTRVLLSRKTMTALFDGAFFKYVEGDFSFGEHFARRVKHAMTTLSLKDNPYLSYILLGRYFSEAHLPTYLRPEHYESIRTRIDRISVQTIGCAEYFRQLPDAAISKFNFTNIFEWIAPEAFENILRETWRVGTRGAVLTYRNLLVHRERPAHLAHLFASDRALAGKLLARDRSFIYRNYVVENIVKDAVLWNTPSVPSAAAAA
jgi:S-adenosylmethionine-diacylglycerol 3-amino-3-carboxypropyl transferase